MGKWLIRGWQFWSRQLQNDVQATERALAAIAEGSIGDPPRSSGDISEVLGQLNVQELPSQIVPLLRSWSTDLSLGDPAFGGDSSKVQGLFAGL